jgi:CheY-like chemotaxis protein
MSDGSKRQRVSDHDLRHHLALLVLDLRLSRERLERGVVPRRELAALLERLDAGLARASALLDGCDDPAGRMRDFAAQADRAPVVAELWDRFRRAGRLPAGAVLRLRRPLALPGDPSALHSLVLNLLENACSAAPEGPLRLDADDDGLRVENGGALLDAAVAAGLNRGEAPPPRGDGGGRGLGLVLSRARSLGLELAVAAEGGVTRFALRRFPAREERVAAPSLLVIEDDADLRAMLVELLRQEGFRVEASGGRDTPLPRAGLHAAVLADLNLPGQAGDTVLAAWKAADPALRTLLLTGDRAAASRQHPGVDAVVVKPGLDRLLELLTPLLGGSR